MKKKENTIKENKNIFIGIPECLLPTGDGEQCNRFEIVRDGPRNLEARPFDYRNPFPIKTRKDIYGDESNELHAAIWPVEDSTGIFDYYCNGRAAVGLPGGPECAWVDVYGTLRCFTGAWGFALGEKGAVPGLRLSHLLQGHIPVVLAETNLDGLNYRFEYFAAEITGAPLVNYPVVGTGSYKWAGSIQPKGRNLFLCVSCTVSATGDQVANAVVQMGFAQKSALCAGAFYTKPAYAPPWKDLCCKNTIDGQYRLTASNAEIEYTLGLLDAGDSLIEDGKGEFKHWPKPLNLSPERTALHYITVSRSLTAGQSFTLRWLIPYFPLRVDEDSALLAANPSQMHSDCINLWEMRRKTGMQVEIPEDKVQDAFLQALNHLDICSVVLDYTEFPTPGPSGGHHIFYERDDVDLMYAYDLIGEYKRAERMFEQYWLNDVHQESSGMALWLYGKHFELTRDALWLLKIMPDVIRRMSWLIRTWTAGREENGGLLPSTNIGDNELMEGHFMSYHLYALAGIRGGINLAKAACEDTLAAWWEEFYRTFHDAVLARMELLIEETGGVITPGFEGYEAKPVLLDLSEEGKSNIFFPAGSYGKTGGTDWHNIAAVFPTEVLPPDHQWMTSSLARWRHAYLEGVFPYPFNGDYRIIHNYNTINLSETWLRRGDYAETLRDLYGMLLHTTATHGSGEGVDTAARTDDGGYCIPHNWFSSKLVRFIRDILVYEGEDRRLHLLGCLPPAWMSPGKVVGIRNAPTELGNISFRGTMRGNGFDLEIDFAPRPGVKGMVLHLPPFLNVINVEADGVEVNNTGKDWILPVTVRRARANWSAQRLPDISFARVVDSYVSDYRQRIKKYEIMEKENKTEKRF